MVSYTQKLGMGRIGVFGNSTSAQTVQQKLGQIDPRKILFCIAIRAQLVKRVQGEDLSSGQLIKAVGRNPRVHQLLRFHGAFVAIAKRIGDGMSCRAQAHIIHGPTVHSNRSDSFGRKLRAGAQALFHPCFDRSNVPTEAVRPRLGLNWRSDGRDEFPVDLSIQRSRETRQLSAPRSTATSTGFFLTLAASLSPNAGSRSRETSFIVGKPRSNHRPPERCGRWYKGISVLPGTELLPHNLSDQWGDE